MLSGFTFSRIVIVQSLEPEETQTGEIISEYIAAQCAAANVPIPVEVINCGYAGEFLRLLEQLAQEAAAGRTPLLHVECHGDASAGLEFQNGSTLAWGELSAALLPLNLASRFNLLAVFSACYGAHFLGQLGVIEPAPCWCMVGPTEEVDPAELMEGFRAFYSALFRDDDMGSAVKAIGNCRLSQGYWLWEPAELWFERVVTGYVKAHCSEDAARKRARRIRKDVRKTEKKQIALGKMLRILRAWNRKRLLSDYFNKYFIVGHLPENERRFEKTRQRVKAQLNTFRSSGLYAV